MDLMTEIKGIGESTDSISEIREDIKSDQKKLAEFREVAEKAYL